MGQYCDYTLAILCNSEPGHAEKPFPQDVLKGVTFSVEPRMKVAVVGVLDANIFYIFMEIRLNLLRSEGSVFQA